ncbi:MAG TPA: hypothetical protein VMF55_13875 [Solirubrobacterales bacterium]|nr:hypothetical protein [Solirubrobacterales bacterium]
MQRVRDKLTYANVMATVAVFIALGGAGYAAVKLPKNSVGTRQLKNGAVSGAKIKDGAVTAAKIAPGVIAPTIDPSKLGTVPSATNAAHATTAEDAAHATTADDASTLQGLSAAQITADSKLRCPAGTSAAGGLCLEDASRGPMGFFEAERACAEDERLLPPESALIAFLLPAIGREEEAPAEWAVAGGGLQEGHARTLAIHVSMFGFTFLIGAPNEGTVEAFRCAALPTN